MGDSNVGINTSSELKKAINMKKVTAPGKDRVSYAMLKDVSDVSPNIRLILYNKVCEQGNIPKRWKLAVIISIRNPGKDPKGQMHYHLILGR